MATNENPLSDYIDANHVVPVADPLICRACDHPLSEHSGQAREDEDPGWCTHVDEEPGADDYEDGHCFCDRFNPHWDLVYSHPKPCKHPSLRPSIRGQAQGAVVTLVCEECGVGWFCIPITKPVGEISEVVRDAFLEGRDDEAWAVMAMAFEPPPPPPPPPPVKEVRAYSTCSFAIAGSEAALPKQTRSR